MVDGPDDAAAEYYDYTSQAYYSDLREEQKLDAYVARPEGDARPWYERVAEYGMTRAIDANFGPAATNKTGQAATFAGQNGKTYSQVGVQPSASASGSNLLPLALAAAVAFLALG